MKTIKQLFTMMLIIALLITSIPATSLTAFANSADNEDVFRIKLTWDASPRDLDSHLEGEDSAGEPFHIYYGNKEVYDIDDSLLASLDTDDTTGYGPENTTIFKSIPNKTFRFYVYNYSGESPINGCGAIVELYKNDVLIGRYTPPENSGDGSYWNLFQILNGNVYVINKIANTSLSSGKNININANNLNKNNIVITPKIAADDDNDLSYTASNVQMKKSTESQLEEQVNGSFVIDGDQNIPYSATLIKEDYRNYVIPQIVLNSWEKVDLGNLLLDTNSKPSIFHSSFLKKDRKDGKPYISTVFCQKVSQKQNDIENAYIEIQHESIDINKDDLCNIIVSAEGLSGKSCTYYIAQDENRKISNETGVFSAVDLFSILDFQKTTYAYLITQDGVVSELMPININKIAETERDVLIDTLKTGKLSLLGENTASVKIPSSVPLLGDAEISLDSFKIPAGFEYDGNTIKVSIGANIFNANTELKKNSPTKYKKWVNEYFKDWKESIKSVSKSSDKDKNNKAAKSFKEKWGIGEQGKNKEKNWDVDFLGYIELEIVDGKWIAKEAAISVEGSFSFEYTVQGAIWIVPTYFSLEAGCSLGATGVLSRMIADSSIPFEFDLTLKLAPELELGAGVGYKKAVSAGLYAEATLPISFEIGKRHLKVQAQGEIGVEAKLFVFSGKKKLLDGTLNVLDKYFGTSQAMYSFRNPSSTANEAEIEYSIQDRDYLKNTSEWLYGAHATYSLRSPYKNGLHLTNLQTSVYENAMPKVVCFGDKMLMTWVEDSDERDACNRMRLMYSVYEGSVWSTPQPVYDDGFNDNAPLIVSDGNDVFFAWQKLCKNVTEDDLEDVDGITNYVEIFTAKYDADSNSICNVHRETTNDIYDYSYYISAIDGQAELYYVSNNNSVTLTDNTVYKTDSAGNGTVVLEDLNYIIDLAVSEDSAGNTVISYLVDDDGDTLTTGDIKVYTYKPATNEIVDVTAQILETIEGDSQLFVSDIFYADFCGEKTLFAVSGKEIFYINSDGINSMYVPDTTISGDVNYLIKNSVPMLFWTSNAECGNAVYMSSYKNGEWSDPIAVSDTNTILTGVTVVNYNNSIKGICTSSDLIYKEEEQNYILGQTNLCAFDINEKYDVEVDSIKIEEENIHIGQSTTFSVCVKNNGSSFVEDLQFTIADELGYQQSKQLAVNLVSGESKLVELEYVAPNNYGRTNLTVSVESNQTEISTENNTVSKEIGLPKITFSDTSIYKTATSYIISAFVTNESDVSANNVEIVSKLDDNVIHSSSILENIAPRESSYIDFEILASELPFEENSAKVFLSSESQSCFGETITILLKNEETECLHPVTYETTQAPTCIKDGKILEICAGCECVVNETPILATGHFFESNNICSACSIERINENETKNVSFTESENVISLVFTPSSDEEYCLFSNSQHPFLVTISEEKSSELYIEAECNDYTDFKMVSSLAGGVSYILNIENFSNDDVTLPITIAKFTAATNMYLSHNDLVGYIGTEYYLNTSFSPANAITEDVTWSSSNEQCVEVDDYGNLHLNSPGTAVITATSENGLTDVCTITVIDYPTIGLCEQKTVEITEMQEYGYFYFTPEEDGTYKYYSISDADTYGYILDATDNSTIKSDDESGEGSNFCIECDLVAGTTYVLKSKFYSSSATGAFDVKIVEIVDATGIQITEGDSYTGQVCSSYQLNVEFLPGGAREEDLTWSSNDETVATVDENGYVDLIKEGTTTINVTSANGHTDSITVVVTGYPKLVLDQEVIVSSDDNSGTAIFSFDPETTGTYIFYSYDNSFDTYGYLYDSDMSQLTSNDDGGGNNNFEISYNLVAGERYYFKSKPYSSGSTGTYSVIITMLTVATSVSIIPDKDVEIFEGYEYRVIAELAPENSIDESYTWSSSNTSVATIDNDGNIIAISSGTTTITVTTENGLTDSITVTVHAPEEIRLDESKNATLTSELESNVFSFTPSEDGQYIIRISGDYYTYTSVVDSDNNWINSNSGYYYSFKVSLSADENYRIATVLWDEAESGEYSITIEKLVPATSLEITQEGTDGGYVGDYGYLYTNFGPENAIVEEITWVSSNPEVAVIESMYDSSYIRVNFVSAGTTTITATSANGLTDSIVITVAERPSLTSIEIGNGDSLTGYVGIAKYLWVNFYPDGAAHEQLTWSSDNEAVATVNEEGKVELLTTGTVNITVVSESGLSDTCTITVGEVSTLTIGQPVNLTIVDNEEQYVKFVPTESGLFRIYVSDFSNSNRARITLCDSSMNWLVSEYDEEFIDYEFVAGQTYYIETNYCSWSGSGNGTYNLNAIKPVPATSISFDIGSEYNGYVGTSRYVNVIYAPDHAITESITWSSTDSSIVSVNRYGEITLNAVGTATITATSENGLVYSCVITVEDFETIEVGQEKNVVLDGDEAYFYFTPDEDGYYSFYSYDNDHDTYGYILNSDMEEITSDDDGGDGNNFKVKYQLEAGVTYVLKARFYNTDNTGTFNVCVEQTKLVTAMEIISMPNKTEYIDGFVNGYNIDYSGLKLKVTWSDGSTTDWTYDYDWYIDGEYINRNASDIEETGNVELTCGDASVTLTFTIIENPVDHLELISGTENSYIENYNGYIDENDDGEYFYYYTNYPSDAVIRIVYKNGTSITAKVGESVDGYGISWDNNQDDEPWVVGANNKSLVTYLGHTVVLPITVKENTVTGIEVLSGKVTCIENAYGYETDNGYYYYYDMPSDVTVKITYNDGTSKIVNINDVVDGHRFNWDSDQYETPWVLGDNNYLTVSYLGNEAQLPVSVITSPVERIVINSAPSREYVYGDYTYGYLYPDGEYELYPGDLTGLSFTVYYVDGTNKTFTADDIDEYGDINGYGYELYYDEYNAQIGDFPVEFMYMGKTANYIVVLKESTVSSIAVTKQPNKVTYDNRYAPDFIGMEITIKYTDQTTKVVTLTEENLVYDYNPGWGEITYVVNVDGYNLSIEPYYGENMYYVAYYLGAQCDITNMTFTNGKEIKSIDLGNVSSNGDKMTVKLTYTDETTETITLDMVDFFDYGDSSGSGVGMTENGLVHYYIETYNNENGRPEKYNVYIFGEDITVEAESIMVGDVNSDGSVDNLDRVILSRYLAHWEDYPESSIDIIASDVNGDGSVDNLDRVILSRYLADWEGYETVPHEG